MVKKREHWASDHGFILATIGAAVGLGNIWRFSYVAGENGGGAFLLVYLVCVIFVGAPIVIAEMALGRQADGDAVAAFETVDSVSSWRMSGWVSVIGSGLILSFYAVIAGWALKYWVGSLTGALWRAASEGYGGYFERFIANTGEPLGWQMAMLCATMFIVTGGVQKGIEAVNRVLMPLLGLCVIGLAAYSAMLPGAGAGWQFLFSPDWNAVLDTKVIIAALGQAFFSLGVGMGVFMTYASYMSRQTSVPRAAAAVILGDTVFALAAGLAIFPAVFAFGMDPEAGPKLAFITLPQIFLSMPAGKIIGATFFGLLVLAGVTSMVALMEVSVATLVHRTPLRRWQSVLCTGASVWLIGIPLSMSFGLLSDVQIHGRHLLDFVDQMTSSYVLPLAGMLVALFVGWRWTRIDALQSADLEGSAAGTIWLWIIRYITPVMIALILFDSVGSV